VVGYNKAGAGDLGIPDSVFGLFSELETLGAIGFFAEHHGLQCRPFDRLEAGGSAWVYNLVGFLHGRQVTIQIMTTELLAANGKTTVTGYVHLGPPGHDDGWLRLDAYGATGVQETIGIASRYLDALRRLILQRCGWSTPAPEKAARA
jgi:hypothetical protein